jgi:nucleoside-diphosphate kinase
MIKPDAVAANHVGDIIRIFEQNKLRIVAAKMLHLSRRQAEGFYAVHREKKFFGSLTEFMSSGPMMAMVLEGEDAIPKLRTLMGATDPTKADAGTVRKQFAESIERNAIHGSDAPETAAFEISYFFSGMELAG